MPWACFLFSFLRSFACAFDRFDVTVGRISIEKLRFLGPFLIQMGPKVDSAPGAIHILLCFNQTWEV